MKCRSFKAIREDLEKIEKIGNKQAFFEALPLLVEACSKISAMRKTIASVSEIAAEINEKCSEYALEHDGSLFVNGLTTDGKGVKHGDIDVDGKMYHFASGYGKFIRDDGDNITQSFLAALPAKWTKAKLELDTTGITRLGVTFDELSGRGLIRSTNNVWSLVADTTGVGDE